MKTFNKGGVHPAENKISKDKSIEILSLPKQVSIPLSQHLGVPAKALVQKGETVKVGQMIAKGEAFISANIHSSVSGKVLKIDDVIDQSGYKRPAIVIDVEGDEWEPSIDKTPELIKEIKLTKEEIVKKIQDMGIVGLGGATFPSHVKLMVPQGKKADCLIINAVECEPYLTSDHRIMLERGEEMLIGVKILMKALDVKKAFVGIENNKPDAIQHLTQLANAYPDIEIVPLKVKYPQGAEKQLIKAVIRREVPSGKLPIEVGAVVNNAGTAVAVYEAVQKNKPLFERVVTVTGKSLPSTANLMVRIGTPINTLIDKVGGMPQDTAKVVSGGPMMGKALTSIEAPVTKGTSGIVLFDSSESKRVTVQNCIRCARCTQVCPMGLEPFLLAQQTHLQMWTDTEKNSIMDCIECGSCQYTCPSGRPLLDNIRVGKAKVGQIIRNRGK